MDSKNSQTTPTTTSTTPVHANHWAPLTRKRHILPHPAQPQHTNHWPPRTRKRHQQEHRPQRPTEAATRRNMRREERVTVQGPVKKQQPDRMPHGVGGGGAHVLHKGGGCAPRAGRCPPRGWQQGRDQPTAHGTVHVVRRCEILVRGGRRVGQEWVRERGTQERQQTGGGVTQTHKTREPHQEGQG